VNDPTLFTVTVDIGRRQAQVKFSSPMGKVLEQELFDWPIDLDRDMAWDEAKSCFGAIYDYLMFMCHELQEDADGDAESGTGEKP